MTTQGLVSTRKAMDASMPRLAMFPDNYFILVQRELLSGGYRTLDSTMFNTEQEAKVMKEFLCELHDWLPKEVIILNVTVNYEVKESEPCKSMIH